MNEQDANALIGMPVENKKTGSQFIVRDVLHHDHLWLSGGQLIPFDAFERFWRVAKKKGATTK